MKFGIRVLYEEWSRKREFRENRFTDKHIFRQYTSIHNFQYLDTDLG